MTDILDRSGLAQQLGFVLRRANSAVWDDLRATLQPLGLKPQTYATLIIIDTSPGCKQQDIADTLGIQRPNLVALVDGLVERGLIDRKVSAEDRRSYALELSEKGRALLEQGAAPHKAHEMRVAAVLGETEGGHVLETLKRLAAIGSQSAQ